MENLKEKVGKEMNVQRRSNSKPNRNFDNLINNWTKCEDLSNGGLDCIEVVSELDLIWLYYPQEWCCMIDGLVLYVFLYSLTLFVKQCKGLQMYV